MAVFFLLLGYAVMMYISLSCFYLVQIILDTQHMGFPIYYICRLILVQACPSHIVMQYNMMHGEDVLSSECCG